MLARQVAALIDTRSDMTKNEAMEMIRDWADEELDFFTDDEARLVLETLDEPEVQDVPVVLRENLREILAEQLS